MLHILILYSFINLSQENQENIESQILPKENQYIKGIITNLDEKISKTQIYGFGLWFKWQPFSLQDILSIVQENQIISFLNEQVIEQIDIIINIYQGNVNSCKPLKQLEDLIKNSKYFQFQYIFLKVLPQKFLDNKIIYLQRISFLTYQDFRKFNLKIQTFKEFKQKSQIFK